MRVLLAGAASDVDEALLLTWELISNAVQHSRSGEPGGTIDVMVTPLGDRIRVEVRDAGPVDGKTPELRAWHDETGRGLQMVAGYALDWGWVLLGLGLAGTVVWFEVPRRVGLCVGAPWSGFPTWPRLRVQAQGLGAPTPASRSCAAPPRTCPFHSPSLAGPLAAVPNKGPRPRQGAPCS
jgi:anti-sigma regulatory factor (Ser/Thr protein kinase)